ncbi:MAG: glutamate--tRNA ligase [Patescibacteria group bacterium]|nr:glutamate--tRNA ligase [Patescibacteria group bacterium]
MNLDIVTRFAPSPTGNLNIGGVRAGIFAYLFARHNKGRFIVRIEDTDRERSKKEFEENILESLAWLGIEHDALYRQSAHAARHEELLRILVEQEKAYLSREAPNEEGGREEVIRFRNPGTVITFTDAIHGEISFDTAELKDFVIAKSFSEPLFHFGVVVDDWDEGVTHVIRGEDHISNTPRQILIQEALGAPRPHYAHLPLIMGSDGAKLSKRKGAKAITEYRGLGYLPEAVLNYDALLGWHPEGEKEIFSRSELIEAFTLERVQKSPATFDETKLLWFNREHLKLLSDTEFSKRLRDFSGVEADARLIPLLRERSQTLKEASDALAAGEYGFLCDSVSFSKELLLKGAKADAETVKNNLQKAAQLLKGVADEAFTAQEAKRAVFDYATGQGRASVLWPLRVALSGREKSPDPFTLCALLGKEKTLERIAGAVQML